MRIPELKTTTLSWLFGGSTSGDPALSALDVDRLRAHQIGAVISVSPALMVANLVNGAITVWLFRNSHHGVFLALWSVVLIFLLGDWLRHWLAVRNKPRDRASARGTRNIVLMATLFALVWAAPTLFLFADASDPQRGMLAANEAGMITGGAIALATVWQAATAYFVVIEVACLFAFVYHGGPAYLSMAAMSAIFAAILTAVVGERSRTFVRTYLANRALSEKSEGISRLLREFEQNASDWLFEIDADGRLARVSERLADVLGEPPAHLEGRAAASFLAGADGGRSAHRHSPLGRLLRAFFHRQPFRDLVITVDVRGQERVWCLSGRPVFDAAGGFQGFLGVGSDVTEAHRAEASIRRMANYDSLTSLPNRAWLHLHLGEEIDRVKRDGGGFALLSLDLDRFKQVNDTLGHGVGDRLLIEVGRRIAAQLGEHDRVARFGGDEFVILQRCSEPAEAETLASRLVESLSANYEIDGQRINIGVSIGIAMAPLDGENGDDLLRNSDLALYRAKSDGRGVHRFFSAEMHAVSHARRLLELDLREALQSNALEVHFQPLVDINDATICACEALARWSHPTRGYIPPAEFVPVAEETGLIIPLGAFVLRRACEQAAAWKNEVKVAVNLSALQFKTGDLVGLVKQTLAETGLAPDRLELEITESILIDDKNEAMQRLSELRALGVRIALDDFGTGYSSLAYLSTFPFDKIKIDRSFVRNVGRRPDAAAIVGAIIKLARALGICTTAEGVETPAELEWLRDNGCNQIQGYLVSRPLSANAVKPLLSAARPALAGAEPRAA